VSVGQPLPARQPWRIWVSMTAIALLAWPYWAWLYRLCAAVHFNDFGKFYYGVLAWREGRSLYALSPASYIPGLPAPLTNLNPPHAMLPVWPLSFLPLKWAYGAWMLVNIGALAVAMTVVCRTIGWRPTLWQLVVLLTGAPMATLIVTGQLSGLLALPLLWGWLAWREGRLSAAGLWLGTAVAVKPFLGLLLAWMLWRGEFRALRAAAVSAAASFFCGVIVFGVAAHTDWLGALRAVSWTWGAMNASLLGIVTRALTVTPYHVPLAVAPWLVPPIWLAATSLIVVLLVRRLRHASIDEGWGLLAMAALLVSPLGWTYYLWWILPGLRHMTSRVSSALLLLPLSLVGLSAFAQPSPWLSFVVGSAYGWALLGAFLSYRVGGK